MIPLRDDNPTTTTPVVTLLLIGVCVAVFLQQQQAADGGFLDPVTERFSMVPARVLGDEPAVLKLPVGALRTARVELSPAAVPEWLTLLTCTFLHGSWLHLLGNVWILWIFGDNVEERFGRIRYLLFYLVSGVLASATHLLTQPDSAVPTVGASGAIAGVMGAYLLLYPRARVLTLIPLGFLLQTAVLPAFVFLGLWFALQVVQGVLSLGMRGAGGVAWWAHIGGFLVGALIALALRAADRLRPQPQQLALRGRRITPTFGRRNPWR